MRRRVRLAGARAVVVDAGTPTGRAIALALAEAGADVACVGAGEAAVRATAASCADRGRGGGVVIADPVALADRAGAERVRAEVVRRLGDVDLLVVASTPSTCPSTQGGTGRGSDADRTVTALGLVAHVCDVFGEAMAQRRRGQVVVVVPETALRPRDVTASAAAGAVAHARLRRAAWRRCGVGVSVVCAGAVAAPRAAGGAPPVLRVVPGAVAAAVVRAARRDRSLVLVGARARAARPLGPAVPVAADVATLRPPRARRSGP